MMKTRKKNVLLVLVVSFLASILSYGEYFRIMRLDSILLKFHNQFLFIISLSLLMSIVLVFIRRPFLVGIILVMKWFFLIAAGYPLGSNVGIEGLLMTSLLFEIGMHYEPKYLYIFLPICVGSFVLMQHSVVAWGIVRDAPDSLEIFHYICVGIGFSGIIGFIKSRSDILENQERLLQNLDKTIAQLSVANKGFQEHVIVAQEKAERDERNRISREIHDTVGYTMTNLIMMMESATDFSKTNIDKTRMLLLKARKLASESLDDTRRALRELRQVGDRKQLGIPVINNLIKNFSNATGVRVQANYGSCPWSFGNPFDEIIYHIVQEGLVNAFRHGQADSIMIHLWCDEKTIQVSVRDNGKGTGNLQFGIGLTGMKERLNRIGSSLKAENTLDGFEITAELNRAVGETIE